MEFGKCCIMQRKFPLGLCVCVCVLVIVFLIFHSFLLCLFHHVYTLFTCDCICLPEYADSGVDVSLHVVLPAFFFNCCN